MSRFKTDPVIRFICLMLAFTFSFSGQTMCTYALIGMGPVGALQYSVSAATGIRLGTVSFMTSAVFVGCQFIILKKEFSLRYLLQLFVGFYGLVVVNFVFYNILGSAEPFIAALDTVPEYIVRMLIFLTGIFINATSISVILALDMVGTPVESFMQVLSDRFGRTPGFYKTIFDFIFILIALGLCLVKKIPLTIREGTVINALLFGRVLDLTRPWADRVFCSKNKKETAAPE